MIPLRGSHSGLVSSYRIAGSTARFDDVWMQQWQLDKLAELAGESCNKGAAIEIGVHQGLSAIPIAHAVFPDVLHAVDHREGVPTSGRRCLSVTISTSSCANLLEASELLTVNS